MRTTVTLDADVEQLLREAMQRGRKSFKEALNEAVRRGLRGTEGDRDPAFVVNARPMRLRPGIDPAEVRDLDDELELEEFLRKTRAFDTRQ
ncbi:MAG: antitoxin [Acidobacteria bacterium]|nr:MAG: antitoxin [Acidobacteriota bacterium]